MDDVLGRLPTGTGLSQQAAEPEVSALRASIPSAAQVAAEAEAAKREKHKPKSMNHKRWQAVHSSTKGWHVALVDCPIHAQIVAHQQARNVLRQGDMAGFLDAAADALLARCKAEITLRAERGEA